MRAPVEPLVLTSKAWAAQTLALYPGEIAWEVTEGQSWYMLRGDGEPANGGTRTGYERLRVPADTLTVNVVSFPLGVTWLESVDTKGDLPTNLDPTIRYLCKVREDRQIYEYPIGGTEWKPLELPQETVTVSSALETIQAEYFQLKETVDIAIAGAASALGEEIAAREAGDEALGGRLDEETEKRAEEDGLLKEEIERVDSESRERDQTLDEKITAVETESIERDQTLGGLVEDVDAQSQARDTEQNLLIEENTAHIEEVERRMEEEFAPLDSPHFRGEPEVPDPFLKEDQTPKVSLNMKQAVPLRTWKDLYDLTFETSGEFIREVDTHTATADGGTVEIVYMRKLDVDPSVTHDDILREADHEKLASEHELNILWDVVMSTFGDDLRGEDLTPDGSGKDVIRLVDRADGVTEFRVIDKLRQGGGCDEDATWVDYTGQGGGGGNHGSSWVEI